LSSLFKRIKGVKHFEVPAGHGDSAVLREITSNGLSEVPAGAAGLPPSVAESLLVSPLKAQIPAGAFANRRATPGPRPSFPQKTNTQNEGGKDG